MPIAKDQLKAQLLQQYSAQLDKLFADLDQAERLHLTEIEDAALAIRNQVSQDITASLTQHESQSVEVDEWCPECHQVARYKGKKTKWIKTRSGDVEVERAYWYCPHCRTGFFPTG